MKVKNSWELCESEQVMPVEISPVDAWHFSSGGVGSYQRGGEVFGLKFNLEQRYGQVKVTYEYESLNPPESSLIRILLPWKTKKAKMIHIRKARLWRRYL